MARAYKQLNNSETIRQYALFAFIVLLALNGVFYLFFINFGVSEIFLKKRILSELKEVRQENQTLLGNYLATFKNTELGEAYETGFIEDKNPSYAARTAIVAAVPQETKNSLGN